MVSPMRITTLMAVYVPLILSIMTIGEYSVARELRPSDHGLEYQSMPPEESSQMMSFFKAPKSLSNSSNVALPRAMNSNDTSWWNKVGGGDGGGSGDHVRHVLFVASLVCGVTGVSLLVASGFIYLFRYQKQRSASCTNNAK